MARTGTAGFAKVVRTKVDERTTRIDNGDDLGDRLRKLALWIDQVPPHARRQVAVRLDWLALLLGQLVADADDGSGDAA